MGYYFIDDEDGYIRRFDDNGRFIPNDDVVAFAPGPGFDWSTLKKDDDTSANYRSPNDEDRGGGGGGSSGGNRNVVPRSVQRAAERYAQQNKASAFEEESTSYQQNASDLAKDAYIAYRQESKKLPSQLATKGYYGDRAVYTSRAYAKYQEAVATINSQMEDWNENLEDKLTAQEQKDIKDYISRWKQGLV